jgi:hypothetical protein
MGALSHFFPPQPRRATPTDRKTKGCRVEPVATVAQVGAEFAGGAGDHGHPVDRYTGIR